MKEKSYGDCVVLFCKRIEHRSNQYVGWKEGYCLLCKVPKVMLVRTTSQKRGTGYWTRERGEVMMLDRTCICWTQTTGEWLLPRDVCREELSSRGKGEMNYWKKKMLVVDCLFKFCLFYFAFLNFVVVRLCLMLISKFVI